MIENMPLLVLAAGFISTAALLLRGGYRGGLRAADLGSVSHHWVAMHRASERG